MMGSLVTTKLYLPSPRRNAIPRPRLVERLNRALDLEHQLIVVSAPAGYGKTTLISEWVQSVAAMRRPRHCPVAWLSLDRGDDDVVRFLSYLLAALETVDLDVAGASKALQAPRSLADSSRSESEWIESVLAVLINELAASAACFVLVLDDYHLIQSPAVHDALGYLLDHLPPYTGPSGQCPGMHLVLATRADPPLSMPRRRARGQVTEIRQSDLRFTVEEASAFLSRSIGLELAPSTVVALEERTEGWIAGLQLFALAVQNTSPEHVAQSVATFSGRVHFVLDYLTDEVLSRQPSSLQTFLLYTSILERMCGALCDAVLGDSLALAAADSQAHVAAGSQAILEQLEHTNQFLVPLDSERRWYRYHQLFIDLLRVRLEESQPGRATELHRRAAAWYSEHGLLGQAIHHTLAAGDNDRAADAIEKAVQDASTWTHVDTADLRRWLDALPEEVLHARPRLQIFSSRVFYVTGQHQAAERLLQEVERQLEGAAPAPDVQNMLGAIAADRASFSAMRGEVHRAIALARQAMSFLSADDLSAQMRVASILGLAHSRAGQVIEASAAFSQAIAAANGAGIAFAAAPLACNLADVLIVQGELRQAIETCQQAMQMSLIDGKPGSTTGYVQIEMGKILYEQNDLPAAARHVSEGLQRLDQAGTPDSFGAGRAVLARIEQAQGKHRQALATIQDALQTAEAVHMPRLVHLMAAHRARIWLDQGQRAQAAWWAREYRQTDGTQYLREFEDLTLARVMLAQGEPSEALAWLERIRAPAEAAGRMGSAVEALALSALAMQALDDAEGALDALVRALDLAQPEGYVRVFMNEGQPMARLLMQVQRRQPSHPVARYAGELLAALGDQHSTPATEPHSAPPSPLVQPLTDREIEVLCLVADGLTNPEIARRLVISLPTVKSHTHNIYGKLDVHRRREAVAKARALGMLPTR